jgi:hypothetical protein
VTRRRTTAGAKSPAVPNYRLRHELCTLELVMPERKPWFGEWQKALKEWNMRESTVIQGFIDQGFVQGFNQGINEVINERIDTGGYEGILQTFRRILRALVKKRFGKVPAKVLRRINSATDPAKFQKALVDILDVARPEDLTL